VSFSDERCSIARFAGVPLSKRHCEFGHRDISQDSRAQAAAACQADLHRALGNVAPNGFWQDDFNYAECPLHDDHNHSFCYQRPTRTWRCEFGCGEGDLVALGCGSGKCGIEGSKLPLLSC
jgi:hypothetical protein